MLHILDKAPDIVMRLEDREPLWNPPSHELHYIQCPTTKENTRVFGPTHGG